MCSCLHSPVTSYCIVRGYIFSGHLLVGQEDPLKNNKKPKSMCLDISYLDIANLQTSADSCMFNNYVKIQSVKKDLVI